MAKMTRIPACLDGYLSVNVSAGGDIKPLLLPRMKIVTAGLVAS